MALSMHLKFALNAKLCKCCCIASFISYVVGLVLFLGPKKSLQNSFCFKQRRRSILLLDCFEKCKCSLDFFTATRESDVLLFLFPQVGFFSAWTWSSPLGSNMKVKMISRNPDDYQRETNKDIYKGNYHIFNDFANFRSKNEHFMLGTDFHCE